MLTTSFRAVQLANLHNRQHFEVDDDEDKLLALRKSYLELKGLHKTDHFINATLKAEGKNVWPTAAEATLQFRLKLVKLPDKVWGLIVEAWDAIR